MCGINGFIRPTTFVTCTESVLNDLNYFSRVRGVDALGAFKLKEFNKSLEAIKEAGDPSTLIKKDNYKEFFRNPGDYKYFVMHNRSATRGSKDDENSAHPFIEDKANGRGKIVLVHNGTITSNTMAKDFPGVNDSHSLTKMLAAGMPIEDIEAVTYGGYALVWLDTEDNSLHFSRNNERPFGFVHCSDSIWFGSETYMVGAACQRRAFNVQKFEFLKPHEEWTWHFDGKELEKRNFPLKPKTVSKGYGTFGAHGSGYAGMHSMYDDERFPFTSSLRKGATSKGSAAGSNASTGKVLAGSPSWARRPKFSQIKEHDGWKAGDTVIFSMDDYSASNNKQVKFEGNVVIFRRTGNPEMTPIQVVGMVAGPIEEVDKAKGFWSGKLTNIASTTIGNKTFYRFSVRGATVCDGVDNFRFPVESEGEESISPLEPKDQTESRGTPSTVSDKDWHEAKPCYNCGVYYPLKDLYVNKHVLYNVELDLCIECLTNTAADPDYLFKLFEDKRKTNHPIFVDPEATSKVVH